MRIAILEDDPDQLALLKRWLSDAGHDVHAYTSGRDTMRLAGRESFDLYVLDWQVPDVSGADVLKWIRGNREEALKLLGAKWFKDTAADALAVSFDALLPALSGTGEFTQASLQKFVSVYKTIGENVDIDLSEGKLWTNEFVK